MMKNMNQYLALLGIKWAYENYEINDLKNKTMNFEVDGMKVTQPLDPHKGLQYIEPIQGKFKHNVLDNIYSLTTRKIDDYINPTT